MVKLVRAGGGDAPPNPLAFSLFASSACSPQKETRSGLGMLSPCLTRKLPFQGNLHLRLRIDRIRAMPPRALETLTGATD